MAQEIRKWLAFVADGKSSGGQICDQHWLEAGILCRVRHIDVDVLWLLFPYSFVVRLDCCNMAFGPYESL